MFVNAGFILGFDGEKGSVADAMIACIEETAIPVCMVGLLYALPNTQLTRRLATEGRLFPNLYTEEQATSGIGDQCTAGLNFSTPRARREILTDYKKVLQHIYSPAAYFERVRRMALALDRPSPQSRQQRKAPDASGFNPTRRLGAAMALGLAHCTTTAQGA